MDSNPSLKLFEIDEQNHNVVFIVVGVIGLIALVALIVMTVVLSKKKKKI
jgi:hypothetical protein